MNNTVLKSNGHYAALARLALPIVIGQLGVIALSFADTYMVGTHNATELGAAAFDNSIFNLCIIFSTGFSYGLVPVAGGMFGRREYAEAGQALRCSLLLNFLVGLAVCAVMLVLYFNLHRLGQPEELLPLMRTYYLVLLASLPFVMLFNAFRQFTDSINQPKVGMCVLLTGNALNIVLNYLLINGKMGLPELGLMGAGLSTLISRILMLLSYIGLFFGMRLYATYRKGFLTLGWSKQILKQLNVLGWPIAIQMGMETASFSLTAIIVGWLGAMALASHQVMLTISQFTFMVYYGLGSAIAVRTSNFMGQRDVRNVRSSVRAGFHLMLLVEMVQTGILLCFYKQVGGWFTNGNAEVSAMVASLFLPFVIYQFGDGLQITFSNALRGLSDIKSIVPSAFIAYFVISLPLCYIFAISLGGGLVGVWMSFPFGLTMAGLFYWLRYRYVIRSINK